MKIYKYITFTIMLFLICVTNTYAACTQEEINEFKKIEDEYTVKYEFNKSTKDYILYLQNPERDKFNYFIGNILDIKCEITNNDMVKCINIKPGTYNIEIIGATNTCNDKLNTITLKLAEYNKYYNDPLCEGIEEFVLCQETYDKEIDYDTFVSRVNTYKKTKEKENNNNDDIPIEEKNEILEYLENNLTEIIIIAVFIILMLITTIVTAKSIKKSRRLE